MKVLEKRPAKYPIPLSLIAKSLPSGLQHRCSKCGSLLETNGQEDCCAGSIWDAMWGRKFGWFIICPVCKNEEFIRTNTAKLERKAMDDLLVNLSAILGRVSEKVKENYKGHLRVEKVNSINQRVVLSEVKKKKIWKFSFKYRSVLIALAVDETSPPNDLDYKNWQVICCILDESLQEITRKMLEENIAGYKVSYRNVDPWIIWLPLVGMTK